MNNNLFTQPSLIPSQSTAPPNNNFQYAYNPLDYAENVLKNNIGKTVQAHVSFTDSIEWRDSIFRGTLTDSGKDYIVIYDNNNRKSYLIWNVYLDYIIFDDINTKQR